MLPLIFLWICTPSDALSKDDDHSIRAAACISNNVDKNTKHGDAILNQNCPGWNTVSKVQHKDNKFSTSAKLAFNRIEKILALAFRGTKTFHDWMHNANFMFNNNTDRDTYPGFVAKYKELLLETKFYGYSDITTKFWAKVSDPKVAPKEVWIIGDSQGGSVAELFALENIKEMVGIKTKLITFGKPKTVRSLSKCDVEGLARLRVVQYRLTGGEYYVDPVPYLHQYAQSIIGQYIHCSDPILLNYDDGSLLRNIEIALKLENAYWSPPYLQQYRDVATRGILHTIPSYYASLKLHMSKAKLDEERVLDVIDEERVEKQTVNTKGSRLPRRGL